MSRSRSSGLVPKVLSVAKRRATVWRASSVAPQRSCSQLSDSTILALRGEKVSDAHCSKTNESTDESAECSTTGSFGVLAAELGGVQAHGPMTDESKASAAQPPMLLRRCWLRFPAFAPMPMSKVARLELISQKIDPIGAPKTAHRLIDSSELRRKVALRLSRW